MIGKRQIEQTLHALDTRFRAATSTEAYDPRTRHRPGEELAGSACMIGVGWCKSRFWKWLKIKGENASSSREANWFAKLAIIELCGWIEESMDEVVRQCARRHLKLGANQHLCESEIIQKTYGFEYEKHFRGMLIRLLGLVAVEHLENQVDPTILAKMEGALSFLKPFRNSYAHTHLKMASSIDAPSLTKSKLLPVYEGLVEFDRVIRRGSWRR